MQFISSFFAILVLLVWCLPSYAVSSFVPGSVVPKFTCADPEGTVSAVAGVATIDTGTTRFYVGTHQATAINQNPIVAAFGASTWCKDDYETGGPDGRGIGLLFEPPDILYVAFTIDGGDVTGLQAFTGNGWINGYGPGGGAKVSVILRLDPATGNVYQISGPQYVGTFIIAKLSSGDTNTLTVTDMSLNASNQVVVTAKSFFSPLNPDKTTISPLTGGSPFPYTVTLLPDLSDAVSSSAGVGTGGAVSGPIDSPLGLLLTGLALIGLVLYRSYRTGHLHRL